MSTDAVKWAIEQAPPMPAQLVATLTVLAHHADKKGRGAYPSVPRIAALACKAERSVRRDLRDLERLKLIRMGDQSLAAHLPADKRPVVYDLALEFTTPGGRAGDDDRTRTSARTLASSRERGRAAREAKKSRSAQESTPERPDVDVRGDVDVRADVHVPSDRTWASAATGRPRPPNQELEPTTEGGAREVAAAAAPPNGNGTPLPDDFAITDPMRRWAKRDGYTDLVDIDYATQQFISHFRSTGARRKSWPDAWQKWIREDANKAARNPRRRPAPRDINPHDEWMHTS